MNLMTKETKTLYPEAVLGNIMRNYPLSPSLDLFGTDLSNTDREPRENSFSRAETLFESA
jgi:hypothetical protein